MDVVRNLGVLFDSKFSFINHVILVIKSCFANLRDLNLVFEQFHNVINNTRIFHPFFHLV